MRKTISGLEIAYEIIGSGDRTVAITPGGRYSKDTPGIPDLAERIAAAGYRVLIWDRPNAGESDLVFQGPSEALVCSDILAELLKELEFGPTMLVGGSAGSRQSLLTALRHPEQVKALFLFWISGGTVGLSVASLFYAGNCAIAAARGGMEEVVRLPIFEESIRRNPKSKEQLLAQNPDEFIALMQSWADAFFPQAGTPVPGHTPADLQAIKVPTLILRGDANDIHHPRSTSEELHGFIPGSKLEDPIWGSDEWSRRLAVRDEHGDPLFSNCAALAPQIVPFFDAIE